MSDLTSSGYQNISNVFLINHCLPSTWKPRSCLRPVTDFPTLIETCLAVVPTRAFAKFLDLGLPLFCNNIIVNMVFEAAWICFSRLWSIVPGTRTKTYVISFKMKPENFPSSLSALGYLNLHATLRGSQKRKLKRSHFLFCSLYPASFPLRMILRKHQPRADSGRPVVGRALPLTSLVLAGIAHWGDGRSISFSSNSVPVNRGAQMLLAPY